MMRVANNFYGEISAFWPFDMCESHQKKFNNIEGDIFFNKSASIFWDFISNLSFKTKPRTLKSDTSKTQPITPNLKVGELICVLE